MGSVKPVGPDCIAPLDRLAFVWAKGRDEFPAKIDPWLVIDCQTGNRPI